MSAEPAPTAWELHTLTDEIRQLDALLDAEQDDERSEGITALRAELVERLVDLAEPLALAADARQARADALDARAAEYRERAQREKRSAESLRTALMDAMLAQGMTVIPGERATLRIQQGPPAVDVDEASIDLDMMPDQYVRVTRALDKRAILDTLKAGETIHGCQLVRRPSLRVRLG